MLRTVLSTVTPRATAASRSLAARRSPLTFTSLAVSSSAQGGRSLALDRVAAATATRSARRCSWREMSSASAKPLVLEKPKKIQKFCGESVSDNMDKTIKVAVPYWYYVKGLGRRIVRYSKIMAHDEENSANVGDTVILVDCRQKSKRKKHKLLTIVRKLPRLDDI